MRPASATAGRRIRGWLALMLVGAAAVPSLAAAVPVWFRDAYREGDTVYLRWSLRLPDAVECDVIIRSRILREDSHGYFNVVRGLGSDHRSVCGYGAYQDWTTRYPNVGNLRHGRYRACVRVSGSLRRGGTTVHEACRWLRI